MRWRAKESLRKPLAFAVEIKRRALRIVERLDQKRKKAFLDAVLVLKDECIDGYGQYINLRPQFLPRLKLVGFLATIR